MAVDIPVVVDIDAAFADAARRVPSAMKPIRDSIGKLYEDLASWQDKLNKSKIDSPQWKNAAKNIQTVSQAIEVANDRLLKYTTNDGSIKRMNGELAALARRWEEMGASQKFKADGSLSAEAQKLWEQYKRIVEEIKKSGKSLAEMEAEEQRVLELARKESELRAEGAQRRRYENSILNSTVKTMRVLQEQERILSRQLGQATIGSDKYKQLQDRLRGVQAEMKRAQGVTESTTRVFQRQTSVLGKLTTTFASYMSIYTLLRFAKQIRDVTGELEYQRVALGHLIQDEEYGASLFERIKAAAIESPFRIKDLTTYTKQLAAFRIEQENLFSTMTRLADISAGLGVDMDRLILAYGQVRAASVLRGQELRQFTEAGIPLVDMLAEKFTELNGKAVKTADVFELISKRAVPFSMISEIFEDLTDKGGMFYEMQKQQAETLKGRWEKLKDAFDIGLQTIGETDTFEKYNNAILKALTFLAKNLQIVPKAIEAAGAAWLIYTVATTRARIATRRAAEAEIRETVAKEAQTIANARGIKHVDAYTRALIRQRVATNALERGFWKLWAAVVASPLGALLAVIGAIATGFLVFKKRADEVANSFEEIDELIEKTSSGLKNTEKIDKTIDRYERLATKIDRTAKENNRLYQTMTQLQEAFPEIAVGIDNETESLESQLEKLREANRLREEEIRLRAETELGSLQVKLDKKENERNEKYKERLKNIQKAAKIEREWLGKEGGYKEITDWKQATELAGDISAELTKQDKEILGIQKRIEALNRILYGDTESALNAWQKQIQSMRDITVDDVTSPLFTDEEIEKWETLDVALDAVGKAKKKAQEQEDSLSKSIENQTGDIRKQIQSELDWARATRVAAEAIEDFFKTPTIFAKDIMNNFSELLIKTYDESVIKDFGEKMKQEFSTANVDLLTRPMVDAADLVAKGWENAGEGIATVYSSLYDFEDEEGNPHNILVTPILPDGTILSPEELDKYVSDIIKRSGSTMDMLRNDKAGVEVPIILGVDVDDNAGERLHELQEEYYRMVQMRKDLPEQFLISEKDLVGLREATDVATLIESKLSAIEKELERVELISIENLDQDEIEKTENYKNNLRDIYDWLKKLEARFLSTADAFPDIAQDIIDNFDDILGRNFKDGKGVTVPVEFLINDKELKELYNTADLFDLLDKKISGIEKEIEKVNEQKLSPDIPDEVLEQAELYRLSLESVYQTLLKIQGRYRDQLSDIAKDVKDAFPDLMAESRRSAEKSSFATQGLFTNEELKRIGNIVDLYDVWSSKIEAVRKAKENFNKQFSTAIDEQTRQNAKAAIDSLDEQEQKLLDFMLRYGFLLPTKTTGGGLDQDPWVILYKNRMKFMQDFQKGVEDMDKYLAHSASLGREQKIMKGRGLSLGIKTEDLLGTPEELKKWYSEAIDTVAKKIRDMGGKEFAGLGVTEILAKDLTGRKIQKYQDLLAELWKGLTDFDTDQIKKDLEDQLKRISEELKRSETARNFYKNILDLTGDEQLAATMTANVYGGVGDDFKERMQKQLNAAFESLDWTALPDNVWGQLAVAVSEQDFSAIMDNLDWFPEEWQKVLKEMASDTEKFNANWAEEIMKTYQKTKTYEERISDIHKKEEQKRKEISESDILTPGQKEQFTAASIEKENRDIATVQVEALKNTYEWGKAFEDLDRVGNVTLRNLREKLEEIIEAQKDFLTPEQLKAITEALEKVRTTQAKRDPLQAIASGATKAALIAPALKNNQNLEAHNEAIEKIKEYNKNAKETEKIDIDHLEDEFRAANKTMEEGIEGVSEYVGQWKQVVDVVTDAFNLDDVPVLGETLQGVSDALSFVATILPVIITLNGILNATLMANPFIAMAAAIIATIGAIVGLIKGIINAKVEKLNKKIEDQSKLLDELEYQYDQLEKAMEKSFGSDYIYNYTKQLENLSAQQAAYLEQARLEREKGKKADEEKIKDYEDSARDAADQIADMRTQLSEFFSGTDLTSAAEDFASAWIEAYKEFGSTTDAMSEKFNDMIESMINRSLAAKIMQEMLQPIFDQIDTLSKDGLLSTTEIASIAALAQERIPMINEAMTNLMTSLASAGLDVRASTAGFKGISRDIAGASEESILGLAAAVNTQNYYISYVPQINENVAAILAAMTGGETGARRAPAAGAAEGEMLSVQEIVNNHIPDMHQQLVNIASMLRSVITTKNNSTNTAYIAVK